MATAVGKVILSLSFFLFQRNTLWALRWECYFEFFFLISSGQFSKIIQFYKNLIFFAFYEGKLI